MDGETAEGLSMLRDLVHAEITLKELARQTGLGEKALLFPGSTASHRLARFRLAPTDGR
jgi:hypothetical protein